MSMHGATWRVHTSSLDDVELIQDAISWIAGDESTISIDKDKSIHGAIQKAIIAKVDRKSGAIESLERLGIEILQELLDDDLGMRIDDDKNMHIRIDVANLVQKKISISKTDAKKLVAKGIFKIECYPCDDPVIVLSKLINNIIKKNKNINL